MIASKATGVFVNMTSCSGETTVLAFFFFLKHLCLLILKSNNNLASYVRS